MFRSKYGKLRHPSSKSARRFDERANMAPVKVGIGTKGNTALVANENAGIDAQKPVLDPTYNFMDAHILADLRQSVGDDVFVRVLEKLQTDLVIVHSELKAAIRSNDTDQIEKSTHVLISLSGAFGAKPLQDLAIDLNQTVQDGVLNGLEEKMQDCLEGVGLFIGFVVNELTE